LWGNATNHKFGAKMNTVEIPARIENASSAVTGEVHHVDCGYSTTGMMPNEMKDIILKGLE